MNTVHQQQQQQEKEEQQQQQQKKKEEGREKEKDDDYCGEEEEEEESVLKRPRLSASTKEEEEEVKGGRLILAPMVRACSLPFRILCRELGAASTYTAETIDVKLCGGASQRRVKCGGKVEEWVFAKDRSCTFETLAPGLRASGPDSPVIFQVGSASPEKAVEACRQVVGSVDGLDINLGCAEFFSTQGGMGSALLKKPDTVREIVHSLVREFGHRTEVSAKIRLLETPAATAGFVRTALCAAGCRTVAVHARYAEEDRYTTPHWDQLGALRELLEPDGVHLIANGGVKCREDIDAIRTATGIADVMIGKAALPNPSSVFAAETVPPLDIIKRFLKLCVDYGSALGTTKYSIFPMLGDLPKAQKMKLLPVASKAKSLKELCKIFDIEEYYESNYIE